MMTGSTAACCRSLCTPAHPDATTVNAFVRGIDEILVPHLRATGARRLATLVALATTSLSHEADVRHLRRCINFAASAARCRRTQSSSGEPRAVARQVGVHTRDRLLRQNIISVQEAGCPLRDYTLETASHMLFHCPAARLWRSVGVSMPADALLPRFCLVKISSGVEPSPLSPCCKPSGSAPFKKYNSGGDPLLPW